MPRKKSIRRKPFEKLPAHEAIRVVPLRHPESVRPIAKPAKAVAKRPASPKLTYRDGPLIGAARVFTIFWGKSWANVVASKTLVIAINTFFTDILVSSLMDQLAEYNVSGQRISHGTLIGSKVITDGAPVKSVTDSAIQAALKKWMAEGTVAKDNKDTLYFVFLEAGVVSVMGGSRSCQSYCGYHSNAGNIYYAVMPYPACSGCLGDLSALDALTATSSHELCEAITDPVPGTGWYDDANGEIGDICAWQFKKIGSHTVQLEWSNKQNKCV
jgi:hypothetical protein